jgi:PKD repeat protein
LVPVGELVSFESSFTDNCAASGGLDFGDGSAVVEMDSGIAVPHAYADTGIYTATLTVDDGATDPVSDTLVVVVYDPSDGFTTGGGWFVPDAASYIGGDPVTDEVSKATFGFVVKYKKGASSPDGQLQFQYNAGDINLHSTSMSWLVISDHAVRFKGEATINGEGAYTFKVTANDLSSAGGDDTFKIEIWLGSGIDTENTALHPHHVAQGVLGGGNVTIHKKK